MQLSEMQGAGRVNIGFPEVAYCITGDPACILKTTTSRKKKLLEQQASCMQ